MEAINKYTVAATVDKKRRSSPLIRTRKQRRYLNGAVERFVVFEILCQLALLVPMLGSARTLLRVAAFGGSIYMLVVTRGGRTRHPACQIALIIWLMLAVSIFNPTTNTWAAGCAQVALYVAIMAPLFWVPAVTLTPKIFTRVILFLWIFYSLSAAVGVVQVCFPGHFQPALAAQFASDRADYLRSLTIVTNTGMRVFRPMGLTDTPGGAALAGLYAVLLGLGLLATDTRWWLRLVVIASMILGLAAIGLSQVRSVLIMVLISIIAFFGLLIVRNARIASWRSRKGPRPRTVKVGILAAGIGMVFLFAAICALSLARKSVTDRLNTLLGNNETEVFYSNRGHFLDQTINDLIPKYPLGAGLGRYGMTYRYFGDPSNPDSPPEWVEIQWMAWVLDGGVPLSIMYVTVLLVTSWFALKTGLRRNSGDLGVFAAVVFAYNAAAFADTFDYVFFLSQSGLEFWFLNAALFGAVRIQDAQVKRG